MVIEIKATKEQQNVFIGNKKDYYACGGCCLTCKNQEMDCLCYKCKCKQCVWYEESKSLSKAGRCAYIKPNEKIEI